MNSANYFLTEDGVISRLDTYWDKLSNLTIRLDNTTKNLAKRLFYSLVASLFLIVIVFWLDLERSISLTVLSLFSLLAVTLAVAQLTTFLEFVDLKKRGMILHDELSRELEYGLDSHLEEEVSVEERIILSNFLLSCELPINPYLYLCLLALLPLMHGIFFGFYYLYL